MTSMTTFPADCEEHASWSVKKMVLHMIGNAHIDPVWLWQWQEGFHEVKASFRSALDRMRECQDFVFVASSAAFYEWVEKSDPRMFAEIKRRVAEDGGRSSEDGGSSRTATFRVASHSFGRDSMASVISKRNSA